MNKKKDYINLIRLSCSMYSFNNYYFIRIIVIYLLSQNVTPWVAVSIPIVLEFARLSSRGITSLIKLAIKLDYKKYHIFYLFSFLTLCFIISQCKSVYTIYLFTFIAGIILGIKHLSVTKINTQNKKYESYCFIEEERSQVIGGTLGLLTSQIVYDINPILYLLGFIILIGIEIILCFFIKKVPDEDNMLCLKKDYNIDKKSKKNIIIITSLFGILAGLWCMGASGFEELAPLISDKIGYLNAVFTILEIILLFIISGSLLQKIAKKKKLLLIETFIACIDVLCLLIAAITLSWQGLLMAYIISAFTSTLGDPIWGVIMSVYANYDRTKWVLVNKVYFIIRTIFSLLTWIVCRECVIRGIESFRFLAIILIILIIIVYSLANTINKKIFGHSI